MKVRSLHHSEWSSSSVPYGYEGNFRSPAVQRYLHELMTDVTEHLSSVSAALSMFIEVGQSPRVPFVRFLETNP